LCQLIGSSLAVGVVIKRASGLVVGFPFVHIVLPEKFPFEVAACSLRTVKDVTTIVGERHAADDSSADDHRCSKENGESPNEKT
jgi:hypothetical protein